MASNPRPVKNLWLARLGKRLRKELREVPSLETPQSLHKLRVLIKDSRAIVRLRRDLPRKRRRQLNVELRQAGQRLGAFRDSETLIQALEKVLVRCQDPEVLAAADSFLTRLAAEEIELRRLRGPAYEASVRAMRRLKVADRLARPKALEENARRQIVRQLLRTYKAGKKLHQDCHSRGIGHGDEVPEALHEWRKRVKDLYYQLQALSQTQPRLESKSRDFECRLKRLGSQLGKVRDLDRLALRVTENRKLQDLITAWRLRSERKALKLGERLYSRNGRSRLRRTARKALGSPDRIR